jgi:hypothetical protein
MPEKFPTNIEKSQEKKEVFPKDFYEVLKTENEERIESLKEKMLAENPESLEWVEAIFGMRDLIKKQVEISKKREQYEENKPEDFQDMTEYQFLLTHFIFANRRNGKVIVEFWKICQKMADVMGEWYIFNQLRSGIISQVATARLLEESGAKPSLSHPEEDAFRSIDLWSEEKNEAFQIKGDKSATRLHIFESDRISFPAIKTAMGEHFNGDKFAKFNSFRVKVDKYRKVIGRDFKGLLVVIPQNEINPETGKPTRELVEQFRREHKKITGNKK